MNDMTNIKQLTMSDLEQKIVNAIHYEDWLALTSDLVTTGQPDSENPLDPDLPSGSEEKIALCVAAKLRALGLDVELHEKVPGRPNVIGTWVGKGDGPTLILNDHLDVYPAGDPSAWHMTNGNPYNPTVSGDKLYSRGTSDTRGNLACTLLAVKALRDSGAQFKGTLKCIYTVDEEKHGPNGAMYLLDELGIRADYEITAEPSGWTRGPNDWGIGIAVAHSGNCILEIKTEGTKSHLWRPDTGINAITKMSKLLAALESIQFKHQAPTYYGGTMPMICPTRIAAGVPREMQFTPAECKAVIAVVGIVPGMTLDSVMVDIQSVIDRLAKEDPSFTASVRQFPNSLFVPATEEVPEKSEPVAALTDAYQKILGEAPVYYRKNAYCDTIRFSHAGIPSVTFGPGEDGWPPVNEYIHTPKAVPATQILAIAMLRILGEAE
ncbi:M20/M25/M40 family metallo-hydrolase [Glaciimonas sp. CA11.2]|uniref:M20 family metallopeptidase n=1 Tax=Glaciimonas sp. CA11.2 TaxID=3048601 RepID=UPI002AB39826|nr:M20/M25/M40 family metallo-hydrolase [Glaciimonas sp. CA11.2]MDY7544635.1 M20/M25/M40 family metallo-hydrolase [Glaciimonas sp. CA11.2]MEB0163619.1 M20/M25/M40 family metallo-hydrolase [Glaciimonas sp. CA11.2]